MKIAKLFVLFFEVGPFCLTQTGAHFLGSSCHFAPSTRVAGAIGVCYCARMNHFFKLKFTSIMHKVYIKIDRLPFLEILSFYICLLLKLSSFMLVVAGCLYYHFALDLS